MPRRRSSSRGSTCVFIHGASGGVGLHATQLAHAAGGVVVGSASTPAGADLVRAAGDAHVLDHGSAGYLDELTRITDGRCPSVII